MTEIEQEKASTLADLAGLCAYAFPLLRYIHEPIPAKYVTVYFSKIQEFFIAEGRNIPYLKERRIQIDVEVFFRCAAGLRYHLQEDADDVDYLGGKLGIATRQFLEYCKKFGYKPDSFFNDPKFNTGTLSIFDHLLEIRQGFTHVLDIGTDGKNQLIPTERELLEFLVGVVDFILEGGEKDFPEGVLLRLYTVLDYTFQSYLGIKLPARRDGDVLHDFPIHVHHLRDCWKDFD